MTARRRSSDLRPNVTRNFHAFLWCLSIVANVAVIVGEATSIWPIVCALTLALPGLLALHGPLIGPYESLGELTRELLEALDHRKLAGESLPPAATYDQLVSFGNRLMAADKRIKAAREAIEQKAGK